MHIIRRLAPAEDAGGAEAQHGYFIELPHDTRITVNGRTYINEAAVEGIGNAAATPFMIGPLNRYTIIELLSQPIFFFRRRTDLDYTAPILPKNVANSVSQDEMDRRDTHGEIDAANVDIVWTPL